MGPFFQMGGLFSRRIWRFLAKRGRILRSRHRRRCRREYCWLELLAVFLGTFASFHLAVLSCRRECCQATKLSASVPNPRFARRFCGFVRTIFAFGGWWLRSWSIGKIVNLPPRRAARGLDRRRKGAPLRLGGGGQRVPARRDKSDVFPARRLSLARRHALRSPPRRIAANRALGPRPSRRAPSAPQLIVTYTHVYYKSGFASAAENRTQAGLASGRKARNSRCGSVVRQSELPLMGGRGWNEVKPRISATGASFQSSPSHPDFKLTHYLRV